MLCQSSFYECAAVAFGQQQYCHTGFSQWLCYPQFRSTPSLIRFHHNLFLCSQEAGNSIPKTFSETLTSLAFPVLLTFQIMRFGFVQVFFWLRFPVSPNCVVPFAVISAPRTGTLDRRSLLVLAPKRRLSCDVAKRQTLGRYFPPPCLFWQA